MAEYLDNRDTPVEVQEEAKGSSRPINDYYQRNVPVLNDGIEAGCNNITFGRMSPLPVLASY